MKTNAVAGSRAIVCRTDENGHWSACFEGQPQMAFGGPEPRSAVEGLWAAFGTVRSGIAGAVLGAICVQSCRCTLSGLRGDGEICWVERGGSLPQMRWAWASLTQCPRQGRLLRRTDEDVSNPQVVGASILALRYPIATGSGRLRFPRRPCPEPHRGQCPCDLPGNSLLDRNS